MKIRYIKYWAFAAVLGMGTVSCEDSWTVLLKIIITNRIFTRMTSNVCKESITFITHLGMTFSAVLLKSVKSCPEMYTRETALT